MKWIFNPDRSARSCSIISIRALAVFACLPLLWHASIAAETEADFAGQLLVATEEMTDSRFVETVIYMVKHDSEGTLGLVINRPLAKGPIDDLLKGFGAATKGSKREVVIHYGSQVSRRKGLVLHSDDVNMANCVSV